MSEKKYRVLAINPGSTSTKIGVFDGEECILEHVVRHTKEELDKYLSENGSVIGQKDMRRQLVEEALNENGIELSTLDAVVGRAGRLPAMPGGTYLVNDELLEDVPSPLIHPALLGALIAKDMGDSLGIPGYFVDPTVVDELMDVARITGIPEIKRTVIFHALNQKAVARRFASERGKTYKECNLIIAHLGGGISIAAHKDGLAVDVTNASNGEGPMSPERAGCVPGLPLADMCFSGEKTREEVKRYFTNGGGLKAHLGHSDFRMLEEAANSGEEKANLIFNAMAYQVSKHICSMAAVFNGKIDGVILTGGLAYSDKFTEMIKEKVSFLGETVVYPGEDELLSLAQGALRVLSGEEEAIVYKKLGAIKE